MRYFATSISPEITALYKSGVLGLMNTPASGYRVDPLGDQVVWAADNGCFSGGWSADKWLAFLDRNRPNIGTCVWATVPDVVGDHAATVDLFAEYAPAVRAMGYRVAFVGQDGADVATTPWDSFDCWFAGGSTDWKLRGSWPVFREAKRQGKVTHMGRVNSLRRFRVAREAGYDSVDGTFLAFGPDTNLPKLLRWLSDGQAALFV